MRGRSRFIVFGALAVMASLAAPAAADSGDPDPTFSTDGYAHAAWFDVERASIVDAIAISGHGVLVGVSWGGAVDPGSPDLSASLERVGRHGRFTFGEASIGIDFNGERTDLEAGPPRYVRLEDIVLDGRGGVVVVGAVGVGNTGSVDGDAAVTRVVGDGVDRSFEIDEGFGVDGVARFDLGSTTERFGAVAVDGGGGIVVAGDSGTGAGQDTVVGRLLADGSVDRRFGSDGFSRFDASGLGGADRATAVEVDDEGRVLVAGVGEVGGETVTYLARLSADGVPDPTWGGTGVVVLEARGVGGVREHAAAELVMGAGGSVLVAGPAGETVGIGRFDEVGSPAGSFGDGGVVWFPAGYERLVGMDEYPDGSVSLALAEEASAEWWLQDSAISLVKVDPGGSIEAEFGADGWVATELEVAPEFGGFPGGSGLVAVDNGGRVLVAGQHIGVNGPLQVGRFLGTSDDEVAFVDDDGSVFEADIELLGWAGITAGCNPPVNDRFCPNEFVTRGQMAAFLARTVEFATGDGDLFGDDDGSVFEADIDALARAEVTLGCNPPSNDRFCPHDYVTRGQMAAFIDRAFRLRIVSRTADPFVDDDGSLFEDAIERMEGSAVTLGCNPPENDRFCPNGYVTRGQMAAFLIRALRTPCDAPLQCLY